MDTGVTEDTTSDAESPSGQFAPLFVCELRVDNFRGLGQCSLELEPELTLLVGRNNSGKSRLLRALAIGLGAKYPSRDDLTLGGPDFATIDVILAPMPQAGLTQEFDVRLARRLRDIYPISEDPLVERFSWRTTIRLSQEGLGVRSDHSLLVFDQTTNDWTEPDNPSTPSVLQRSIISADLVETGRDLVDELEHRGSAIRRVLDDLEVSDERRSELESSLLKLGGEIVESSKSLEAITTALRNLAGSVGAMGVPSIHPLPIRLEEIAKSVSVDLNSGDGDLPIRFHGAGALRVRIE